MFFTAWPWAKHGDVNPPRIRFIEACHRAPGLTFEGGFAPRRRTDVPEVLPYTATARYSMSEYLTKVGRSAVAFNNPAVHGCLGWKLGEFLALGKAIVSLPLDRGLPAPSQRPPYDCRAATAYTSTSSMGHRTPWTRHSGACARTTRYRTMLESNARGWYEQHLAPHRSLPAFSQTARARVTSAGGAEAFDADAFDRDVEPDEELARGIGESG